METNITHPTDTHPTIADRFQKIVYNSSLLNIDKISEVGNSSKDLFENLLEIEKELTVFEHRLLISLGLVSIPENNNDEGSNFLNTIYTLAAAMIGADGKIEQGEIKTAESIGKKLFPTFDHVEFRNFCKNLNSLPNFKDIVELLDPILKTDGKKDIYNFLNDIAYADNELAKEEEEILTFVRKKWNI